MSQKLRLHSIAVLFFCCNVSVAQSNTDTLKVVNWNIEWFGSPSNGPTNDALQQTNVSTVLKNTNADVYALCEVVDISRLQAIVNTMPGYAFTVSDFGSFAAGTSDPDYASAQKLAFVYRTSKVNKIRTYGVLRASGNPDADYNWSSGRFPYLMEADVTLNSITLRIAFVLIHAKANTADHVISYNRRKNGAMELKDSLNTQFGTANIILLGDFNDDLDRTITTQVAPDTTTSYISFTNEPANFSPVSKPLSLAGQQSTVSFNDVIDHVVLSNEMNRYYITGSAAILKTEVQSWISNYGNTTTDHYPVRSNYFWNSNSPGIITALPGQPVDPTSPGFTVNCYQAGNHLNLVVKDVKSRPLNIQLLNLNGQVLLRSLVQSLPGTKTIALPVHQLSSGLYFIRVVSAEGTVLNKVFRQ